MWLKIIIIVAIIGGILGYLFSDRGEKGPGCLGGAFMAGSGCAYIIFQIFIWGLGIIIFLAFFGFLFGGC